MSKIRVRIAPSPTGYVHIGNIRTILFNYFFARQMKGDFIVRIEDTDQTRLVDDALVHLLKVLKDLKIDYDEGPYLDENDKILEKGDFGSYIQSERKKSGIYKKFAEELIEKGYAYRCFCTPERLEEMRKNLQEKNLPTKYDRKCLHLTQKEIDEKIANGEKFVIRLKVPDNEQIEFEDWTYGKISTPSNSIDDQVLLKSDGFPTYHLAVVVDDHLMQISHIFRGEDWLPSTPKHILIYKAFGWEIPQHVHIPNVLQPNKKKLSKRFEDVSTRNYLEKGYLPEAIWNYLSFVGWNPGTEQEIMSREEILKSFDIHKIQKSGGIFNIEKLDWYNGIYIRKLSIDEFVSRSKRFLINAKILTEKDFEDSEKLKYIKKVLGLVQKRIKILSEVPESVNSFFSENIQVDKKLLTTKGKEKTKEILQKVFENLTNLEIWTHDELSKNLESIAEIFGRSQVFFTTRVAITGKQFSPGVFESLEVLGKERSLKRIKKLI